MSFSSRGPDAWSWVGLIGATTLVSLLLVPPLALIGGASLEEIEAGLQHSLFWPSFWLSLRTTMVTLGLIIVTGTPLAWWLARSSSRWARTAETLVLLPIILPPAVLGVALLQSYGRSGFGGAVLRKIGIEIPFTEAAVVMAQLVVAAPFFVQATANAFRRLDSDRLLVARTLGASPSQAFFRVALPHAFPGIAVGLSLAWARALGEFGATLLFAGNLSGTTQTMPLAIFSALESDLRIAVVFALVLCVMGGLLLVGFRILSRATWERGGER